MAAAAAPTSAPRKVRPEAFVFDYDTVMALKFTNLARLAEKKRLLEDAERAVSLRIKTRLPEETKVLLAPFKNVRDLFIGDTSSKQLPLLPNPQNLRCLEIFNATFDDVENVTNCLNLETLLLTCVSFQQRPQQPNFKAYCQPFTLLHQLKTFRCINTLRVDGEEPEHTGILTRILQNNHKLERVQLKGRITDDLLALLADLPLRRLTLGSSHINDARLALLPCRTLDTLNLYANQLVTIEALRGSNVRELNLGNNPTLDASMADVICSMPKLEVLCLDNCNLQDQQVAPLLGLAEQLTSLQLHHNPDVSDDMRQRLREAFSDKVEL